MTYSMSSLPEDREEFAAFLPEFRRSPEGAIAGCVAALRILAKDREEGRKAMELLNPETPESSFRLAESQLSRSPWLMDSYFSGTSPENGYSIPESIELEIASNLYSGHPESGRTKLFVKCSGADSARPVTLEKNDEGNWRPVEWSTLVVGIREPSEV